MMQTKKVLPGIVLGFSLSAPLPALAEINWNGFMTVGAGMTLDRGEQYAGYDHNLNFEPDTLLGLQAQSDLGEKLSVTGQLLARAKDDSVKAEWLYLSYEATPNLRLNFGRQRLPFFLYSDYLDVGYAYHFLRPPISVYDLPFSSIDGLSAIHTLPMGDFELTTQLIGGSYEVESGFDTSSNAADSDRGAKIEDYAGINFTLGYNYWLTVRASYHRANLKIVENGDPDPAQQQFYQQIAQAGGMALINALNSPLDYTFGGLAMQIEKNGYLLIAEGTYTEVEPIGFEYLDYYISAGKRFGKFLPYVTFERQEFDADTSLYAGLPPQLSQPAIASIVTPQSVDARVYSVGTRYDFHPSATLKVEVTKYNDQRDSAAPGFSTRDATLLSLAVSTVF